MAEPPVWEKVRGVWNRRSPDPSHELRKMRDEWSRKPLPPIIRIHLTYTLDANAFLYYLKYGLNGYSGLGAFNAWNVWNG